MLLYLNLKLTLEPKGGGWKERVHLLLFNPLWYTVLHLVNLALQ
jgi:hypothetical protein